MSLASTESVTGQYAEIIKAGLKSGDTSNTILTSMETKYELLKKAAFLQILKNLEQTTVLSSAHYSVVQAITALVDV